MICESPSRDTWSVVTVVDQVVSSMAPLLEAEVGLSQLTSLLRSVTRRRGGAADRVKSALAELRAVESLAREMGLVYDLVRR